MPFKSLAQAKLFFAKEKSGEIPKGTAKEWAGKTNFKTLPWKVSNGKEKN